MGRVGASHLSLSVGDSGCRTNKQHDAGGCLGTGGEWRGRTKRKHCASQPAASEIQEQKASTVPASRM